MAKSVKLTRTDTAFEELELISPFGFKGGSSSFLWNTSAILGNDKTYGIGLGVEGILWSDMKVFFGSGNSAGSAMMYLMTDYAARLANGYEFTTPDELLDFLLPQVYEYGRAVTRQSELRMTFALDSLVPIDLAAWQLYYRLNWLTSFDELIPESARNSLRFRHEKLACIPLVSYGVEEDEIVRLAESGTPLLKIKIGKEFDWDIERVKRIHELVKSYETPYTDCGRILYYIDANGRYDTLERVETLLAELDKCGALERVALLEEPFPEGAGIDVSRLPIVVAADESAHSERDVDELAQLGYRAVALKPIAKTLTVTFRMLEAARRHNMKAFCADLTVSPIMVDWNKNVAARLEPLDGMKIGAIESNGPQNYRDWEEMKRRHPSNGAAWINEVGGVFEVGEEFYHTSGGIFADSDYYAAKFAVK